MLTFGFHTWVQMHTLKLLHHNHTHVYTSRDFPRHVSFWSSVQSQCVLQPALTLPERSDITVILGSAMMGFCTIAQVNQRHYSSGLISFCPVAERLQDGAMDIFKEFTRGWNQRPSLHWSQTEVFVFIPAHEEWGWLQENLLPRAVITPGTIRFHCCCRLMEKRQKIRDATLQCQRALHAVTTAESCREQGTAVFAEEDNTSEKKAW